MIVTKSMTRKTAGNTPEDEMVEGCTAKVWVKLPEYHIIIEDMTNRRRHKLVMSKLEAIVLRDQLTAALPKEVGSV